MIVGSDFLFSALLYFVRVFVSSLICLFLGYLGIMVLNLITTKIKEFKTIKGDPLGTGLFVSGFLIFAGLIIQGCMVNPFAFGQNVTISSYFNIERLIIILLGFLVSLLYGLLFYLVFAKLTPFGIDLDDVNKSPVAVGIFLFGYEIFLGLIMYASLTSSL